MEVERGGGEEGRVKRKTLLEVLEQCQKAIESFAVLNDEDDMIGKYAVWKRTVLDLLARIS